MSVIKMADLDLAGKRVLIREDLNVPVKNGKVTSAARIVASLPTIKLALEKGAAVIVCSHLGRPTEGEFSEENSLAPVAAYLTQALGRDVPLVKDYLNGVDVAPGQVVLLENVRFNKGEKKNSDELAQKYAALCDVFVMDAFGTAHRAEGSTHGVARFASVAAAGTMSCAMVAARPITRLATRSIEMVDEAAASNSAAQRTAALTKMMERLSRRSPRGARKRIPMAYPSWVNVGSRPTDCIEAPMSVPRTPNIGWL